MPFVFDNENWAHAVAVEPFRISRAPVTNAEFLAFVEEGGYRNARFWAKKAGAGSRASGPHIPSTGFLMELEAGWFAVSTTPRR